MSYRIKTAPEYSKSLPDPSLDWRGAERAYRKALKMITKLSPSFREKAQANPSEKGYPTWQRTLGHLCISQLLDEQTALKNKDATAFQVAAASKLALDEDSPVRFLSKGITESFLRTKTAGTSIPPMAFEHVIINVPLGILKDDEGAPIELIHVCKLEKLFESSRSMGIPVKDSPEGIHIFATSSYGASINIVRGVDRISNEIDVKEAPDGTSEEKLQSAISAIERIAVHTLLVMAFKPELVVEEKEVVSTRGFKAAPTDTPRRSVVWVGKDFKRNSKQTQSTPEASGGSKAPHWRSGHWHTVKHGKGKQYARLDWFEPVYVNAA